MFGLRVWHFLFFSGASLWRLLQLLPPSWQVDELPDWATYFENVGVHMSGHGGQGADHEFDFQRRAGQLPPSSVLHRRSHVRAAYVHSPVKSSEGHQRLLMIFTCVRTPVTTQHYVCMYLYMYV